MYPGHDGIALQNDHRDCCACCRKIDTSQTARKKEAIGYYRIESAIALFCALLINIFVVSVFARGFYGKASATPHLP